jgi:GAF domain-containing protein
MTGEHDYRAAVAAALVASESSFQALLRSIVEVARAIFFASASSILLLDEETDELVFAAVAGEGEETLVGSRFPSSTGIAGWVLVTRQALVIDDVGKDPRFSREAAERTGYVPKDLMSAPLLHGERALGVLQVLDRPQRPGFSLQEMELLGLFANQAAIAVDLFQHARSAKAVIDGGPEEAALVARVASALDELDDSARPAALSLLRSLDELLRSRKV